MTPKINWNPSNKDLRKFGWTILIGFGIIGGLIFLKGKRPLAEQMWIVSAIVCAIAVVLPPASKPFYWVWMGIAFVLGSIMSRVILTIIFFVVLTPVALIFKLIGRDSMRRRKPSDKSTYWEEHPKISDPTYYDHLF